MRYVAALPFIVVALAAALGVTVFAKNQLSQQASTQPDPLPYHAQRPTGALPATLDPMGFRENRSAYVSYVLASHIKSFLYQVPCHCPCRRVEDHQSLLDCFVGKHGLKCAICQKELLFCYREDRKGKSPAQVREAIAHGKAWKLDLDKEIQKFYRQMATTNP